MTKSEYIIRLQKLLRKLPKEEITKAVSYYEEYFEEAGEENIDFIIEEIGTPEVVAPQIIQDVAYRNTQEAPKSVKSSAQTVWMVILAIFAAPIALPIGIALAAVILAFGVAVLALIISALLICMVALLGGVVTVGASFTILLSEFKEALMVMGMGFIMMGCGVIGTYIAALLGKWTLLGVARLFRRKIDRRVTA